MVKHNPRQDMRELPGSMPCGVSVGAYHHVIRRILRLLSFQLKLVPKTR